MENIFTDSQVSQYSLTHKFKWLLVVVSALFVFRAQAQTLSTENKRSIKLYHKAEESIIDRDFKKAIALLQQSIKNDPIFRESYLKLAGIYKLYQNADSIKFYYRGYADVTPKKDVSWKIWKTLASLHFDDGEYDQAQEAIIELLKRKPEHINAPELRLLKESIDYAIQATADPSVIAIDTLPSAINSFQLQYFPVLTVDQNTMIYTKRNSNQLSSDEDIVISTKSDSGWLASKPISKKINSELNEGACTVSADGRTLIFTSCDDGRTFGSCDLFISRKEGNQWSKAENLGSAINSKYWDSQPSLSADGHTLYFSSSRPGGYGKLDIWQSTLKNNTWSKPINLGDMINGFNDEVSPFIYSSNDLLFFLSNGKIGLGGYDLYCAEKINNKWAVPKNLGAPINSHNDEGPIFLASNGIDAYYSKEYFENKMMNGQVFNLMLDSKIAHFEFPQDIIQLKKSSYVTGVIANAENKSPLQADLLLMNLNDSTDIYYATSDQVTGQYYLTLTEGKEYGVFIKKEGFLFDNLSFETKENSALSPDTINIDLQPISVGNKVTLQNIYFGFDQYELNDKSVHELKRVSAFMKQNKKINFLIEGHSDNRGSEEYNLDLSSKRANAVKHFLINDGIEDKRLKFLGMGSSQLIDNSNDEDAHKVNRRIVFRVIH